MSQYRLRPTEGAAFSAGKATKSDLVRGARMFLGLNCFEPGQGQPVHVHQGADKFYLILSGKARMAVGGEVFESATGDLIWAPADVPHGVAEAVERTVMLVGIASPPGGHGG
ncbi:MAG: cupin domain-containing protein [Gemmatimonadales bacterium]